MMNLTQTLRMFLSWLRVFAHYEAWTLRTRPRNSTGRVDVGDINIYFRRDGSGDPLVMLHGGFMFAETWAGQFPAPVSYTHLRAHETRHDLVCRLLLEKK